MSRAEKAGQLWPLGWSLLILGPITGQASGLEGLPGPLDTEELQF